MSLSDYARILRPINCLMASAAAFTGYAIAIQKISLSPEILLGMLVVFLVCGAGQAINDYFDRNIDEKLHPEKPIPSGKIKPRNALFFSLLLFAIAIILSALLPFQSMLITIIFSILLALYSALIQKLKFIGNIVVALGTAFTIIFGASISGSLLVPVILAMTAFFSNLGREIVKDFEDMDADKGHKLSLPILLPKKTVFLVVFLLYMAAITNAYLPAFLGFFDSTAYILLVTAAGLALLYSFKLVLDEKYPAAQLASKAAMAIALVSFIAGVVF